MAQTHERVTLDRPVMLTARAAYPSAANPFARENYGVPLLLVLQTTSLQAESVAGRRAVELLASLGHSPYADIWLTAGEQTFAEGLAQAQPGAGTTEDSLRALPVSVDYDAGRSRFRAYVGTWSRWRERADEKYALPQRARTVDAYAGALLTLVANRHAFVTCDPGLLAERGEHAWADVNIIDVREAIALVGLLMRQRGRCDLHYDQTGPFERSTASRLYTELTTTLSQHAQALLDAIDTARQLSDATADLVLSAEDRVNDLLVARDEIRVASLLPHGGSMLASALYHLRAAVQTAAAMLDSLAVLACEQLQIPSDPLTVTFRRPAFRQALADADAQSLAAVVSSQRYLALAFFINELRGPIGHGGGVHGVTDLTAHEVTSHLRISDSQAEKLKQAYGQRHESADVWGVHPHDPSLLEIDVFADKLTRGVIEAFDETVIALTADLRRRHPGPSRLMQAWQEGQDRLAQIRAQMPAEQREAIQRREAEQEDAELEYLRRTLHDVTLYAGLADWRLLEALTAARLTRKR